MQDRYAGDIGDYGKFGLLRKLSEKFSIGINWYDPGELDFERDKNGGFKQKDGKYRDFSGVRKFDDKLADALETIKNNQLLLDKIDKNVTKNGKRIKEIDEILEDYEPQKPGIDKQQFHKFKNEVNEGIRDLKRKNADMEKEIEYLKKHPDLIFQK